MSPHEIVRQIDFRYMTDCITPDEAVALLTERAAGKAARVADLEANGYPCYTTSAGWLGYSDEKLARLCREAVDAGFDHIKLRSAAHTSELQSLLRTSYAVFCLKKKNDTTHITMNICINTNIKLRST